MCTKYLSRLEGEDWVKVEWVLLRTVGVSYALSLDRNSLLQFPPAIKMTIPFECVRETERETRRLFLCPGKSLLNKKAVGSPIT